MASTYSVFEAQVRFKEVTGRSLSLSRYYRLVNEGLGPERVGSRVLIPGFDAWARSVPPRRKYTHRG